MQKVAQAVFEHEYGPFQGLKDQKLLGYELLRNFVFQKSVDKGFVRRPYMYVTHVVEYKMVNGKMQTTKRADLDIVKWTSSAEMEMNQALDDLRTLIKEGKIQSCLPHPQEVA